jgi:hypothetical protein
MLESATPLGDKPYWVFVSFLYAWIASDIADRFSKISAQQSVNRNGKSTTWYVPVYSHLALVAFTVGTSWLGWTLVWLGRPSIDVKSVVAPLSLLLIVDFWILGAYFAFTSVVNQLRLADRPPLWGSPPGRHAAFWVWMIFLAYVVWDFLFYCLLPWWRPLDFAQGRSFWLHSWMTVLCMTVAFMAYRMLREVAADSPWAVLAADGALLFLILFYRSLKELSRNDKNGIPLTDQLARFKHPFGSGLTGLASIFLICFAICITLARTGWLTKFSKTHKTSKVKGSKAACISFFKEQNGSMTAYASPIFLKSKVDYSAGAIITFEVLEADASKLIESANKPYTYLIKPSEGPINAILTLEALQPTVEELATDQSVLHGKFKVEETPSEG